jgi:hypothetical protein
MIRLICLALTVLMGLIAHAEADAIVLTVTSSRIAGVAPLAVAFDASGSTGLAQSDVLGASFSWQFGDPGAGFWSTTGTPKNEASGFLAAHVFESPGVYQVVAKVTDRDGQTAMQTVTITVADPDQVYAGNTRCVSQNGDFAGAPAGCTQITSSNLSTQINWVVASSGRRLLFRRGETWIGNFELTGSGPTTVAAFGSGAPPLIRTQPGAENGVWMLGTDARLIDVDVDGSQMASGESAGSSDGTHNLILRVHSQHGRQLGWGMSGNRVFVVDSWIENNGYFSIYTEGVGVYMMGSHIDQIRVATSFSHPLDSRDVYIAENIIDASRFGPSTGIKWHGRRGVISGNRIVAGVSRIGLSNSVGTPSNLDVDRDLGFLLIERNRLEPSGDIVTDQYNSSGISFAFNKDVVVRNNLLIDMDMAFSGGEGYAENVRIQHNSVLMTEAVVGLNLSNGDFLSFDQDLVGFDVSNNIVAVLASISGSAYPEPGRFIQLLNTSGITLSNNLVYKPDHPIRNLIVEGAGAGYYTFAQWMAFGLETGSAQADPAFVSLDPDSPALLQLLASSPAIDRAADRGVRDDYRGRSRPVDGDTVPGAIADIGAFEFDPETPADLLFQDGFE